MTGILIFIAAILIVIMIHEGGHFLVAKAFDFKASQYFLGFGPTVWSFQRGETEYGVKALPLGGFVKIVGMNPYEDVPEADKPRAYFNKPHWQRALVILAGSGTHFIVAFVILYFTALTVGFPEITPKVSEVTTKIAGTEVRESGIEAGDVIVAVDGRRVESWETVQSYIRSLGDREAHFTVERDGERVEIDATLGRALFASTGEPVAYAAPGETLRAPKDGEQVVGFLGVSPSAVTEPSGFLGAFPDAASGTWETTKGAVAGIGETANQIFGGELWQALQGSGERRADEGPLGIVGAGRIASDSVQEGQPLQLVSLIVGFTVFVGLMNLLPLPPLDGGHLAVIAWEAVTRRRVDMRKLIPIAAAVISFFVVLFIAVLYLDLARPIKVPF